MSPTDTDQEPTMSAAEVKLVRETLNMTQAAFAAALNVSKRAVEEWEGGRRKAPAHLRAALKWVGLSQAVHTGNWRYATEEVALAARALLALRDADPKSANFAR